MKAIVNVNQNWGIGKDGELLAYIPEDMRFFRNTTKGRTVIMGRKTLESFPGGKPLKGRLNIVLTRNPARLYQKAAQEWQAASLLKPLVLGDSSDTQLLAFCDTPSLLQIQEGILEDAYVIGGAQIYQELLPYCSECLVTINDSQREADTFFPNLDADPEWQRTQETEEKEQDGVHYRFTVYRRISGGTSERPERSDHDSAHMPIL